jgi:hypothetical protein
MSGFSDGTCSGRSLRPGSAFVRKSPPDVPNLRLVNEMTEGRAASRSGRNRFPLSDRIVGWRAPFESAAARRLVRLSHAFSHVEWSLFPRFSSLGTRFAPPALPGNTVPRPALGEAGVCYIGDTVGERALTGLEGPAYNPSLPTGG